MRVRIRKDPRNYWVVETKKWYQFKWKYIESFFHDDMEKRAIQFAQDLIDPTIIEIKKRNYYE